MASPRTARVGLAKGERGCSRGPSPTGAILASSAEARSFSPSAQQLRATRRGIRGGRLPVPAAQNTVGRSGSRQPQRPVPPEPGRGTPLPERIPAWPRPRRARRRPRGRSEPVGSPGMGTIAQPNRGEAIPRVDVMVGPPRAAGRIRVEGAERSERNRGLPHLVLGQGPQGLHEKLDLVAGGRRPAGPWQAVRRRTPVYQSDRSKTTSRGCSRASNRPTNSEADRPKGLSSRYSRKLLWTPSASSGRFRHGPAEAPEIRRQLPDSMGRDHPRQASPGPGPTGNARRGERLPRGWPAGRCLAFREPGRRQLPQVAGNVSAVRVSSLPPGVSSRWAPAA